MSRWQNAKRQTFHINGKLQTNRNKKPRMVVQILLNNWNRNKSTNGVTPWQFNDYDDDDEDDEGFSILPLR